MALLKNVRNYTKNMAKSLALATIDDITQNKMPIFNDMIEQNREFATDTVNFVKNFKSEAKKLEREVKSTEQYTAFNKAYKNAKKELKSGKIYRSMDSIIDSEADAMWSDMAKEYGIEDGNDDFKEDWENELDDSDESLNKIGKSSAVIGAKLTTRATLKGAGIVSDSVLTGADYVSGTIKHTANMQYAQSVRQYGMVKAGFDSLSTGIGNISAVITGPLKTHIENATKFYSSTNDLLTKQNAMINELLEMERNRYKKQQNDEKKRKGDISDIVDLESGAINLQGLLGVAKGNIKNSMVGELLSYLSDPQMIKMFAANPMSLLATVLVPTLMGPNLNKALEDFGKTLSGIFPTMLARIKNKKGTNAWGPFSDIVDLFAINSERTNKQFTARGATDEPMAFNGLTQKAIIEVIPGYLARIEAALTGRKEDRIFNYKTGKWTTYTEMNKQYNKDRERILNSELDSDGFITELINNIRKDEKMSFLKGKETDKNRKLREKLDADFSKVIEYITTRRLGDTKEFSSNNFDKMVQKLQKTYNIDRTNAEAIVRGVMNISNAKRMRFTSNTLSANRRLAEHYEETNESQMARILSSGQSGRYYDNNDKIYNSIKNGTFNTFETVNKHLDTVSGLLTNIRDIMYNYATSTLHKKSLTEFKKNIKIISGNITTTTVTSSTASSTNLSEKEAIEATDKEVQRQRVEGMNWGFSNNNAIGFTDIRNIADLDNLDQKTKDRIEAELGKNTKFQEALAKGDRKTVIKMMRGVLRKINNEQIRKSEADDNFAGLGSNEDAEDYQKLEGRNLSEKLKNADGIFEKLGVLGKYFAHIRNKPTQFIADIIGKVDDTIYNFFYDSTDPDRRDSKGRPIRGFFNNLSYDMDQLFKKMAEGFKTGIVDPIKRWFSKSGGKEITDTAKDTVKNIGKSAFGAIGSSFKGVYNDLVGTVEGGKAQGGYVPKTGLYALSKGEAVIPSDMNPYNPDRKNADRNKDAVREQQMLTYLKRRGLININGAYATGTAMTQDQADKRMTAINDKISKNGKYSVVVTDNSIELHFDNNDKETVSYDAASLIGLDTVQDWLNGATNTKDEKSGILDNIKGKISELTDNFKKKLGRGIGKAAVGGITGLMLMGPVGFYAGALVGGAFEFTNLQKHITDTLFGDMDEETGKRDYSTGLLPKKLVKALPDIRSYGILGGIAGGLTMGPLGLIGGLALGGTAAYLVKANKVGENIWGNANDDSFAGKTSKFLKNYWKRTSVLAGAGGVVTNLLIGAGPYGVLGGMAIGAGMSLVSTSESFKDAMLGTMNTQTGKREGGVKGAIMQYVVDPLKVSIQKKANTFDEYLKKEIFEPSKEALLAITKSINYTASGIFKMISKMLKNKQPNYNIMGKLVKTLATDTKTRALASGALGTYLGFQLGNIPGALIGGALGFSTSKSIWFRKFENKLAKGIIGMPFKTLSWVGKKANRWNIKRGYSNNWLAEKRLEYMEDTGNGNYKTREFDERLSSMSYDNLKLLERQLNTVKDLKGKKGIETTINSKIDRILSSADTAGMSRESIKRIKEQMEGNITEEKIRNIAKEIDKAPISDGIKQELYDKLLDGIKDENGELKEVSLVGQKVLANNVKHSKSINKLMNQMFIDAGFNPDEIGNIDDALQKIKVETDNRAERKNPVKEAIEQQTEILTKSNDALYEISDFLEAIAKYCMTGKFDENNKAALEKAITAKSNREAMKLLKSDNNIKKTIAAFNGTLSSGSNVVNDLESMAKYSMTEGSIKAAKGMAKDFNTRSQKTKEDRLNFYEQFRQYATNADVKDEKIDLSSDKYIWLDTFCNAVYGATTIPGIVDLYKVAIELLLRSSLSYANINAILCYIFTHITEPREITFWKMFTHGGNRSKDNILSTQVNVLMNLAMSIYFGVNPDLSEYLIDNDEVLDHTVHLLVPDEYFKNEGLLTQFFDSITIARFKANPSSLTGDVNNTLVVIKIDTTYQLDQLFKIKDTVFKKYRNLISEIFASQNYRRIEISFDTFKSLTEQGEIKDLSNSIDKARNRLDGNSEKILEDRKLKIDRYATGKKLKEFSRYNGIKTEKNNTQQSIEGTPSAVQQETYIGSEEQAVDTKKGQGVLTSSVAESILVQGTRAHGGYIPESGAYALSKGEQVVPSAIIGKQSAGGTIEERIARANKEKEELRTNFFKKVLGYLKNLTDNSNEEKEIRDETSMWAKMKRNLSKYSIWDIITSPFKAMNQFVTELIGVPLAILGPIAGAVLGTKVGKKVIGSIAKKLGSGKGGVFDKIVKPGATGMAEGWAKHGAAGAAGKGIWSVLKGSLDYFGSNKKGILEGVTETAKKRENRFAILDKKADEINKNKSGWWSKFKKLGGKGKIATAEAVLLADEIPNSGIKGTTDQLAAKAINKEAGKGVSAEGQKLISSITKQIKTGLTKIAEAAMKFVSNDWKKKIVNFCNALLKRFTSMSPSAIIKKVGNKAGTTALKLGSLALPPLGILVNAGFIAYEFYDGWTSAGAWFEVKEGEEPSTAQKLVAGFANAAISYTPLGWFFNGEDVINIAKEIFPDMLPSANAKTIDSENPNGTEAPAKTKNSTKDKRTSVLAKTQDSLISFADSLSNGIKSIGTIMKDKVTEAFKAAWEFIDRVKKEIGDAVDRFRNSDIGGAANVAWSWVSNSWKKVTGQLTKEEADANISKSVATMNFRKENKRDPTEEELTAYMAQQKAAESSSGLSGREKAIKDMEDKLAADKASGKSEEYIASRRKSLMAIIDKQYPETGKGKYGRSRFGRGPGQFYSQLDPMNAMQFNASGDTEYQDMYDSGCGPVSAVNALSSLGINADPKAAASYALSNGYKEKNGGTKPGYFKDMLGKYGVGVSNISGNSNQIKQNLMNGNPVILMGQDKGGVSTNNPYGTGQHYVTATGLDGRGNIIIQDPQSDTPNTLYKTSNVLGKSSMAFATYGKGKYGKSRFGRGSDFNVFGSNSESAFAKSSNTKTTGIKYNSNKSMGEKLYEYLTTKYKLSPTTVAGIMGNMYQESKFDVNAVGDHGTSYGLCQWHNERKDALYNMAQQQGKRADDYKIQCDYLMYELNNDGMYSGLLDKMERCGDASEAAILFCVEFERPQPGTEGARAEYARQVLAFKGANMQEVSSSYNAGIFGGNYGFASGSSGASNPNSLFGMLQGLSSAMDLSNFGLGKYGRGDTPNAAAAATPTSSLGSAFADAKNTLAGVTGKVRSMVGAITAGVASESSKYNSQFNSIFGYNPMANIFGNKSSSITGSSGLSGSTGGASVIAPTKPASPPKDGSAGAKMLSLLQGASSYGAEITSNYGGVRSDGAMHEGIDYGDGHEGTHIYSPIDGTVVDVNNSNPDGGGYGYYAQIQDKKGNYHIFGHMSAVSSGLSVGQEIKAGTDLGAIGNTGHSSGPHLHYGITRDVGAQKGAGLSLDPGEYYGAGKYGRGRRPAYKPSSKTMDKIAKMQYIKKYKIGMPQEYGKDFGKGASDQAGNVPINVSSIARVPNTDYNGKLDQLIAINTEIKNFLSIIANAVTSGGGSMTPATASASGGSGGMGSITKQTVENIALAMHALSRK